MSPTAQRISIGLAGAPLVAAAAASLLLGSIFILAAAVLLLGLLVAGVCRLVLRPVAAFVAALEADGPARPATLTTITAEVAALRLAASQAGVAQLERAHDVIRLAASDASDALRDARDTMLDGAPVIAGS